MRSWVSQGLGVAGSARHGSSATSDFCTSLNGIFGSINSSDDGCRLGSGSSLALEGLDTIPLMCVIYLLEQQKLTVNAKLFDDA